jgi:hypothetical protein
MLVIKEIIQTKVDKQRKQGMKQNEKCKSQKVYLQMKHNFGWKNSQLGLYNL